MGSWARARLLNRPQAAPASLLPDIMLGARLRATAPVLQNSPLPLAGEGAGEGGPQGRKREETARFRCAIRGRYLRPRAVSPAVSRPPAFKAVPGGLQSNFLMLPGRAFIAVVTGGFFFVFEHLAVEFIDQ